MSEDAVKIGWIGCGRMGAAMATRLLEAGHSVRVTNRTRDKAEALAPLGAVVVDSPRDLADCDVVFIMVSADRDLVEVTSGDGGLLTDRARAPRIVIDSSTVSAETSAAVRSDCAERGSAFLAAIVSGNPKVVAAGQLTLAVSGPLDAYEETSHLIGALGKGATYVGDGETARLVKICHNVLLGVIAQALAEITVLAERGGVSRNALLGFINGSVVGSPFTRYKAPAYVNLDFHATFTPVLLRKDFDLGLNAAHDLAVPMPLSALCREMVASAVGAGYTTEDFAVLLLEQARRAGMELTPEDVDVDDGLGVGS